MCLLRARTRAGKELALPGESRAWNSSNAGHHFQTHAQRGPSKPPTLEQRLPAVTWPVPLTVIWGSHVSHQIHALPPSETHPLTVTHPLTLTLITCPGTCPGPSALLVLNARHLLQHSKRQGADSSGAQAAPRLHP